MNKTMYKWIWFKYESKLVCYIGNEFVFYIYKNTSKGNYYCTMNVDASEYSSTVGEVYATTLTEAKRAAKLLLKDYINMLNRYLQ